MKDKELIELAHKYKMEEIKAETDGRMMIEKFHHECELERQRIKSAEIRKAQMRKGEGYNY